MKRYVYSNNQNKKNDVVDLLERVDSIAKSTLPSSLIYNLESYRDSTAIKFTIDWKDNNCGPFDNVTFLYDDYDDSRIKDEIRKTYNKFKRDTGWSPEGEDIVLQKLNNDMKLGLAYSKKLTGSDSYTNVSNLDEIVDPEDYYEFQDDMHRRYRRSSPGLYNRTMGYIGELCNYLENNPTTYRELKTLYNKVKNRRNL